MGLKYIGRVKVVKDYTGAANTSFTFDLPAAVEKRNLIYKLVRGRVVIIISGAAATGIAKAIVADLEGNTLCLPFYKVYSATATGTYSYRFPQTDSLAVAEYGEETDYSGVCLEQGEFMRFSVDAMGALSVVQILCRMLYEVYEEVSE